MKKPFQTGLILFSILSLILTGGFLFLRNNEQRGICLSYFQSTEPSVRSLVDLNTATLEQLDSLPGIGPKIAQNILEYRERVGAFRDYSQLLNIEGIGQGRLSEILPFITLGG